MKDTVKHFFVQEMGSPMSVETVGVSICSPGQCHSRKNSEITIIEYIFKGKGTLYIEGKKIPVKADEIYILPSGLSHEYVADEAEPWAKYFMNLSGNMAKTMLVSYSLNSQYVFSAPELKDKFKQLIKISFDNIPEAKKQARLVSLYVEILHRLNQLNTESKKSNEAVMLKNYLDENYHRVISNTELAAHIYRSPDYCLKLFKREFGTTPYDYQINNKIRVACSLLHQTRKSVSEIAEFIGYQNPHYFTSMFKAKMGITPTGYRKKFL